MNSRFHNRRADGGTGLGLGRKGFTLFELLVAVAIFAIVLIAINTVFYSALRLRTKTSDILDDSHALNRALAKLRADLQEVIPPGTRLAGSLKIGAVTNGFGMPQALGIELYTTTGVISDNAPFGDIQRVTYLVRDASATNGALGRELVRSVTRNLLATTPEQPEEESLLSDVQTLEFAAYTGLEWRDTWDPMMGDVGLPTAIRVRLEMAADEFTDVRNRDPIELIVPLMAQVPTNQVASLGGLP